MRQKIIISSLFILGILCSSCNSSDTFEELSNIQNDNEIEISDTINTTIQRKNSTHDKIRTYISTRAITNTYDGIVNGTPVKIYSNQKVFITGVLGVPRGVYFADVYETSGIIKLPSGYNTVTFDLPTPCGYDDWKSREEGVLKTKIQSKKSGVITNKLKWSFYTIVLVRNSIGQQMWTVLPEDGAKIHLPFNYDNE